MHGDEPVRTHGDEPTSSANFGLVFPVCTGMNRKLKRKRNRLVSVPRMHGDEPVHDEAPELVQ